MPYTAAQLDTLHALGLVPWVLRARAVATDDDRPDGQAAANSAPEQTIEMPSQPVVRPSAVRPLPSLLASSASPEPAVGAVGESLYTLPDDPESLANWLPGQAVLPDPTSWKRRQDAAQRNELGGAGLLVLFETADPGSATTAQADARQSGALTPDGQRLFHAMMRAIELSGTDMTLATLTADPVPGGCTVSDLLAVPHRAVLILSRRAVEGAALWNAVPLAANGVKLWGCPHPDYLLENPLRKREAWSALKMVRQALQSDRF